MRDAPCFYRSIFENVVLNVTIVLCAVFGFFNLGYSVNVSKK